MHANKVIGIGVGLALVVVVLAGAGSGQRDAEGGTASLGASPISFLVKADPQAQADTARRLQAATLAVDQAVAQVLAANADGVDTRQRRAASAAYVAAQQHWSEERRAFWAARRGI